MLEQPRLPDEKIIACLRAEYQLGIVQVIFLPLGADLNTAVYRVVADTGTPYFLKLRRGVFDETSVSLPKWLSDLGIEQIIPPLVTQAGQLWARLDDFKAILYPFVEGRDGYDRPLSDHQWIDFGSALQRIHTTRLPEALHHHLQQEAYSPAWRKRVGTFMERVEAGTFTEPVAHQTAAYLRTQRPVILDLIERAERYAQALQAQSPELIVCHTDIHAGNVLIDTRGVLYIVDWDNPLLAPKERDLMFVGGGQFGNARPAQAEETLFYRGYGPVSIDIRALAYFRYERIIQDIAVFCEQLLLTTDGGQDREQAFRYLTNNFLPDGTIAIAREADQPQRHGSPEATR